MKVDVGRSGDIALVTLTGEVGMSDLFAVLDGLLSVDREHGILPRLIDARRCSATPLEFTDLSQFAKALRTHMSPGPLRTAILVDADGEFGVARMFLSLRREPGLEMDVFRDEAAALEWLGVDPAHRSSPGQ